MRPFCLERVRGVLVLMLALPGQAIGEPYAPIVDGAGGGIEARLERIERVMNNQGMLDLLDQVERLNAEIKRLRGEIELQAHSLDRLEERQRKWYDEFHRRVQAIEGGTAAEGESPLIARSAESLPEATPPSNVAAPIPRDPPTNAAVDLPEASQPPAPPPGTRESPQHIAAPPSADATSPGETDAYRAAFNLLKTGRYHEAVAGFGNFLGRYPKSPHADNAQYWLAEAHYVAREYKPAIEEYNKLVQNYPESQKLTHALLKIGYSYHELGQLAEARSSLENLRVRYPGTTAAQLAEERLQRIPAQQP